MRCRKLSSCEINNVLANSDRALVSVVRCCSDVSREMCAFAVKVNGSYRLTFEGSMCAEMLKALSTGDTVTVKYTGRNCCGMYCVTAAGEPDGVTVCGCNKIRFTLSDFVTDGVLKY